MSEKTMPVTVQIADKEYKISCPEGEHETLLVSAQRVSEDMKKMRESGKALGSEKIAVMVALNIASELINAGNSKHEDCSDISNQLASLQSSIEDTLNSI